MEATCLGKTGSFYCEWDARGGSAAEKVLVVFTLESKYSLV